MRLGEEGEGGRESRELGGELDVDGLVASSESLHWPVWAKGVSSLPRGSSLAEAAWLEFGRSKSIRFRSETPRFL